MTTICSILGVIAGADGRSLLSATKKESASDHTNLKDYDRDLETKWQQEVRDIHKRRRPIFAIF